MGVTEARYIYLVIHSKKMLAKQVDYYVIKEEGLWQQILKRKYLRNKALSQVEKKKGDSHFWSGLMQVKRLVWERGRFIIQNGTQTRFWEDLWIGRDPLMTRYPSLYNIARKKNASVKIGVQFDYNVVHLRTSLVQSFVLLLQNFEEVVQMIELKRLGGAPNGYPFAPLSENPPLDTLDLELDTFYLVSMSL
jgi:hypothetical protein